MVILAAVTLSSVYDSGIISYALNGTQNYVTEAVRENEIMNQTESVLEEAIAGITGEMTKTELKASIGNYVDYTPTSGTFDSSEMYNGYGNQSFSTVTGLNWRILFVDDDTLTLISDDVANGDFHLYGYNGYNNAVKLLNDACEIMYSNSSLGATARNLNVDDIQSVSSYDETTYSKNSYEKYNDEITSGSTYYPNIFALETNGYVNTAYGEIYTRSQQTDYITGYSQASTLKGRYTYFTYKMSDEYMDSVYYEMFSCNSEEYYLASRCIRDHSRNLLLSILRYKRLC